ncbi:MAG: phage holin family protein [Pseudomonadota bacterium]
MDSLPMIFSGFAGAAGRFGSIGAQILEDRLELLSLEMREAKIRFVQALLLTCIGVVLSLLGILLLVLTGVYLLPPELRLYGLTVAAVVSMLAGLIAFIMLRRHLERKPLAFEQSLAELKKDTTCFSTKN